MERSCQFYSKIPGLRIVYGGKPDDTFSTFELGGREEGDNRTYLNLELTAVIAGSKMTTTTRQKTPSALPNSTDNNSNRRDQANNDNSAIGSKNYQCHKPDEGDNNGEANFSEEEALSQADAEGGEGKGEQGYDRSDFGRIIFHTENVDCLYSYMKRDKFLSKHTKFEAEPIDAPWGERFFHIREPDGYQLSFAQPLKKLKE